MNYQLTKFALDAPMPLIRPDSVVHLLTPGLWGLWTPSCWTDPEWKPVLALCDTEQPLLNELAKVGKIDYINNQYQVVGEIVDPDWWKHRSEDGMLNGLDLSKWGN